MTSAGAIRALRPVLGRTKVGHLGTLDPFASGLLPLCLGEATKVARYLLLERKEYTGTIRLGVATDTLDHTGAAVETCAVPPLEQATVDAVAARFTGRQRQVPPMYSAATGPSCCPRRSSRACAAASRSRLRRCRLRSREARRRCCSTRPATWPASSSRRRRARAGISSGSSPRGSDEARRAPLFGAALQCVKPHVRHGGQSERTKRGRGP